MAPNPAGTAAPVAMPLPVARQPIVDVRNRLMGYELLFRGARRPDGSPDDGHRATAQVLVSAFLDGGIDRVVGDVQAWVNVSRDFLLDMGPLPVEPASVVLELLEDAVVDDELIRCAREAVKDGFVLALDDFQWRDGIEPLVEVATYVKLDLRALGLDGFAEQMARLQGRDVIAVAEKVETVAERDACEACGADLFQGWFFARPQMTAGQVTSTTRLEQLRAATSLPADASFEQVERLVMADPGLSLRVLRLLNSAAQGLPNRVSSIRQALVLLGSDAVRRWATLIALASLSGPRRVALSVGLQRARMCELAARAADAADPDAYFSVGLLSVLDVLLDRPLSEVVGTLPLTDDVRVALLEHQGDKGVVLERIRRQESGVFAGWEAAEHFKAAAQWSDDVLRALQA